MINSKATILAVELSNSLFFYDIDLVSSNNILSLMKMMILISLHALYKSLHQVFHKSTTLVYLQVRTILKQLKDEVMVVKSTVIILMKKKWWQR